jgi:hypothetical protein
LERRPLSNPPDKPWLFSSGSLYSAFIIIECIGFDIVLYNRWVRCGRPTPNTSAIHHQHTTQIMVNTYNCNSNNRNADIKLNRFALNHRRTISLLHQYLQQLPSTQHKK